MAENPQSTQEPSPEPAEGEVNPEPVQQGGVSVGDSGQVTVGGDVAGRDKNVAGENIIQASSGSVVIVFAGQALRLLKLTRRAVFMIGLFVLSGIGIVSLSRLFASPIITTSTSPALSNTPPSTISPAEATLPLIVPTLAPYPSVALIVSFSPACPGNFSAKFRQSLLTAQVTATEQPGGSNTGAIMLKVECSSGQATYHFDLPYTETAPEAKTAEPISFALTWDQSSLDMPTKVLAAALAYQNHKPEQAAPLLSAIEWDLVNPVEKASLEFLLGNAWLKHRDLFAEDALKWYAAALKDMDGIDGDQLLIAKLHNNLGRVYVEQAKQETDAEKQKRLYADALNAFSDAVSYVDALNIQPVYIWPLLNRSEVFMESNDLSKARDDCDLAIKQRGDFAPAYVCRAWVLHRQSSVEDMLKDALQAIEIDSTYAPAHYLAGVGYCVQGNADEAIRQFTTMLELSQDVELRDNAGQWLDSCQK